VSLLMINTILIGYFAKMPLNNRDSGMPMVQGEFFSPFLSPHIWSQEVVNARQMPSTARQIDHVGEKGRLGVFFRFFRFTYDSFFFCGYVGVRIGEEIIVNTFHTAGR